MIRPIVKDAFFLSQPSDDATLMDMNAVRDLEDTLRANFAVCAGMAANMIGIRKKIAAVALEPAVLILINPVIVSGKDPYEAEEGCLSLTGTRKTARYREIRVKYLDRSFKPKEQTFTGFIAQVIQHETDHFTGKLI